MTTTLLTFDVQLEVHCCCVCGVHFGVPPRLVEEKREKGGTFHCPNGHSLGETETEADRLRKRLKSAEASAVAARDQRDASERSNKALRGVITRERRRVANGICPCCNRTFKDLARHMAGQHPGYVEGTTTS